MTLFERSLTLWVALSMTAGIVLGQLFPKVFHAIGHMEIAHINLPVGLLIWVMIVPMLASVDFRALHKVAAHWRGIGVTLFVNWLVKPFLMAFLGWAFIRHIFAPWLPTAQIDSYIAGLVLLAAAPCTAMVFVWSRLCNGDPEFTLSQVALNDTIMVVAFAPLVGLLLSVSTVWVPWNTLILSVVLYIVIPVVLAQLWRHALLRPKARRSSATPGATPEATLDTPLDATSAAISEQARLGRALEKSAPYSMGALLLTLVLLFGFQGKTLLQQPLVILMLAVPILIQVVFSSALAFWLNRQTGESYRVACPSALIGASNFFELAVAASISLFGLESGAALATVVGVLVEVPIMLLVVKAVTKSKVWYERAST